jgi:hypothetical protein
MMASTAMPTAVSMAGSMSILALVGDGAGKSVDPDPIVPTIGANCRGLTPAMPMFEVFRSRECMVGPGELDGDQTKTGKHKVLPRFGPLGRVMTYVLLV